MGKKSGLRELNVGFRGMVFFAAPVFVSLSASAITVFIIGLVIDHEDDDVYHMTDRVIDTMKKKFNEL